MNSCVYYGEDLARYGFGEDHPFGPDRQAAFWAEMQRLGLDRHVDTGQPVPCTETELQRFHTREYIDLVKHRSQTGEGFLDYGDTPAFQGVFEAGSFVVGSVLDAAKSILEESHKRCFVPIAGLHHARRDRAAGFCVFNDIGVLIESLREVHGIRRIAYVDIDAHHGDGVFYAFEDDPDLVFADLHEDGRYLYPGTGAETETGAGTAKDTKLNIPMAPGSGDSAFLRAWPRVEEFLREGRPEFIVLQAGADSIDGDPITHMAYSPAAHRHATENLCRIADEICHGRFLATGGGGYNRRNLAHAWCAVVKAMVGS